MAALTDAEKLAAAEAAMRKAVEDAKAARLPSVLAAQAFISSPEAEAYEAQLAALITANIDDVTGGCKRALERISESIRAARGITIQRVAALQPTPEPSPEPDPT
ncbi:hypothetical protein [Brevundimonas sp.]|uniref:hypothetical protein n=1 Tax=Brevundimonas sp. TaxID=1871086 RepID=UPI00289B4F0E|nr:hypothetical protein [Brevundimonas sp.]